MPKNIKVLHVEDDPMEADIIMNSLQEFNQLGEIEIKHVLNLKDALKAMQEVQYQAVLLDLCLTDVEGIDNVNAIREQSPDLPIIVLSNSDNEDMAMEAIDSGAQEYIVKGHSNGKIIKFAIRASIQRKALERKLFQQANYDRLTGLANRGLLQEHLEKSLRLAKRWGGEQAVVFVDIDKFKLVNDTYGHEAGNDIIADVAHRLMETMRETDIISRYGGDEFVILLDDKSPNKKTGAKHACDKIINAMSEPFIVNSGEVIDVSLSIGVAIYPADGIDSTTILAAADAAMYKAKARGPNSICMFVEDIEVAL